MERKVARICWNSRNWKQPSGPEGKTRNKDAYEYLNGFGHEEWLLDIDKVIDGYHYGYVQAVGARREKYLETAFNLSLYTIDDRTKQRWWLGDLNGLEVVGPDESARVYREYERRGWLAEMRTDLRAVDASVEAFDEDVMPEIFSVAKFRPENSSLHVPPLEFEHGDPAVPSDYYNLKNFISVPKYKARKQGFKFKAGFVKPDGKRSRSYGSRDIDVTYHHADIQEALYKQLCKEYGEGNVGSEQLTPSGTKIDLVARNKKKFTLFEVKVALSVKACVRESLGQLLEYRHDIGASSVSEIVVVSSHANDSEVDEYLAELRNEYGFSVRYLSCVP